MRDEMRQSLILLVGIGAAATLGLVFTVFAGRQLGPALNAELVGALAIVYWCQLALGPINGTVARFSAKYAAEKSPGKIRTLACAVAKRTAKWGLLGGAAVVLISQPISRLFNFQSVIPFVGAVVIVYLTLQLSVVRGVLRGVKEFGQLNANTIVEAGTRLFVGAALLLWLVDIRVALSAYVIALIVSLGVGSWQLSRIWKGHATEHVDGNAIRRFGFPMLILMFTSAGYQNVDMFLAKYAFAPHVAGEYGAAFSLSRTIGVLVTPFATMLLPLLAGLHEHGRSTMGPFFRVLFYFVCIVCPPILVFALWPEAVVTTLYGNEFVGTAQFLFSVTVLRVVGHLCHLVAIAGSAVASFRFLYVYLLGLAIQAAVLAVWRPTGVTMVWTLTAVQTLVLFVILIEVLNKQRMAKVRE